MLLHYLWEIVKCYNMWRNVITVQHFCWQKPCSFTIHDNISYEGDLSFLHKNQVVQCMGLHPICVTNLFIYSRHTHNTHDRIQHTPHTMAVVAIFMKFPLQQALYEFYQCTSITTHECLQMINIIQPEFIVLVMNPNWTSECNCLLLKSVYTPGIHIDPS